MLLLLFLHNYLSHDLHYRQGLGSTAQQLNIVNYFMGMGMANAMCSEYGNVVNNATVSIGLLSYHHNIN